MVIDDFAETDPTNSTTYITEMTIGAWIKPNYTSGSPQFSVLSKGNSFSLMVNNLIDPKQKAEFSIFDGIKWTTVNSISNITEQWTHVAV